MTQQKTTASGPVPQEIKDTFHRLTGKQFDDLPQDQQNRLRTLPPDADLSDIEFCGVGRG